MADYEWSCCDLNPDASAGWAPLWLFSPTTTYARVISNGGTWRAHIDALAGQLTRIPDFRINWVVVMTSWEWHEHEVVGCGWDVFCGAMESASVKRGIVERVRCGVL
jgi:hypothetical protein